MAVLCVSTGWRRVQDREGRLRLVWTQALHWLAFLVAMNLVLLTSMQSMLNADAMGLAHPDVAGARHLCRRSTHPGLGSKRPRRCHGSFRSSHRLGSSSRHFCCYWVQALWLRSV